MDYATEQNLRRVMGELVNRLVISFNRLDADDDPVSVELSATIDGFPEIEYFVGIRATE